MKPILVTYPRSGQHYLVDLFKQQLGHDLEYTHDLVIRGYDKYITIVRDPLECMASWVAMEVHCGPLEGTKEYPIEIYINQAIKEYILFYTYALKNVNIFIKYEDLIEFPESVINLLSKELNLSVITNSYTSTIHDYVQGRFLKTSTTSHIYPEALTLISKKDLSKCYELYNQAIIKSSM